MIRKTLSFFLPWRFNGLMPNAIAPAAKRCATLREGGSLRQAAKRYATLRECVYVKK